MNSNPVWSSLSGGHAQLGRGEARAKRYDPAVAPFGAMLDESDPSQEAMLSLLAPDEQVCLVGQSLKPSDRVTLISQSFAHQMYFRGTMPAARISEDEVTQLADADVPKMVALTDLVFPGFFRPGTIRMGDYFGILYEGDLVAMAGERLAFGGHREISAVCTHPDYQRRGYALKLVRILMQRIIQRGERPFLHVGENNTRALVMYQNLGFASERLAEINFYQRILE